MSFVTVAPEMLAAAAGELQGIGATVAAADMAAATPTTALLPSAADAVSVRTAALFAAHAQRYQELSARAAAFHEKFVQTLMSNSNSYAQAEASNTAATRLTSAFAPQHVPKPVGTVNHSVGGNTGTATLANAKLGTAPNGAQSIGSTNAGQTVGATNAARTAGTTNALASPAQSPNASVANPGVANAGTLSRAASASTTTSTTTSTATSTATSSSSSTSSTDVALIMGGTGNPQPNAAYLAEVYNTYVAPHYPGYTPVGLYTPEQFWPLTGLTSETFGQSVRQGVTLLNNAIMAQTAAGHHVVVLGYSQSATIATLEMRYLDALPASIRPSPNLLSFILLGDPNTPGTGILTHYIPGFGAFHVVTPADTPYTTAIYALQYDPIAYFPKYPLWPPTGLNALIGFFDLHRIYPTLTAAQLAAAVQGHIDATTYYLIPAPNLPLLDPLRLFPLLGNPLADLLQPFVQPFVDLGYGNGSALLQFVNPVTVGGGVGLGAVHGVEDPVVAGLIPVTLRPVS